MAMRDNRVPYASEAQLSETARKIRQYCGRSEDICLDLGAIVSEISKPGGMLPGLRLIVRPSGALGAGQQAGTAVQSDGTYRIFVASDHPSRVYFDPDSRFAVAHELAHLVQHPQTTMQFRSQGRLASANDIPIEYSAEQQADFIARHLLAPNAVVDRFESIKELAVNCRMPESQASIRWGERKQRRISPETQAKLNSILAAQGKQRLERAQQEIPDSDLALFMRLDRISEEDSNSRCSSDGYHVKLTDYKVMGPFGWFVESGRVRATYPLVASR